MKEKIRNALIITLIIVVAGLLLYQSFGTMIPELVRVLKSGNEKEIENYLASAGHWDGFLCTVLLQFIQVISIIIPGMPIQIAAGAVYGMFRASAFCYFGYVSANVVVFVTARHIGGSFTSKVSSKFKGNRFTSRMEAVNPGFAVALGCLMPGVPNGIIPYLAAQTKLTCRGFATAVALGSIFPIVTSCMTGHFLLSGDYLFSIITIAILWILIIVLMKNQDRILALAERIKNNAAERGQE